MPWKRSSGAVPTGVPREPEREAVALADRLFAAATELSAVTGELRARTRREAQR